MGQIRLDRISDEENMDKEGPPLEALTRRLAECPADFLADPRIGRTGVVPVTAVVADLLRDLGGGPLDAKQSAHFAPQEAKQRNTLSAVLIACWLLHDPWFRRAERGAEHARAFLLTTLPELAATTPAKKLITDPDRREELARLCLKALGLRPAGESVAQAQDRLATLNTAERQRVIRAAREAEERAQAVRAAMAAAKAAAASDAKAMRE
jgi:hypothetical protein